MDERSAPTSTTNGEDTTDRAPKPSERKPSEREDGRTESFVRHRGLLFTVAYEMLGSPSDAEDVLQETWLRWMTVDVANVRDHRAYLVRITTRKALDRMRTLRRRRETYVGPWLPEPLLTMPDVADDVELAESVSIALMVVLESLTPTERAVFVLREVFDLPYQEITEATGKSLAAVRQIARRARVHVDARRPHTTVSPAHAQGIFDAFHRAVETGDVQQLLNLLAPDVVLLTDGGGVAQAATAPIVGAEIVARFLGDLSGRLGSDMSLHSAQINGNPGLLLQIHRRIDTVLAARFDESIITGVYAVRNPDKLGDLANRRAMTR